MTRFRLTVLLLAVVVAGGCSAGKPAPSAPTTAPRSSEAPQATKAPRATEAPATQTSEDLVIVRRIEPTAREGFAVVFGATGEVAFDVPDGAASQGFRRVATATADGSTTVVRFLAGEGGETRAEHRLDGSWRLPTIGVAKRPAGISADGNTVVLERSSSGTGRGTSFAVARASGSKPVKVLDFEADLSFDALSPDGSWLYMIVHRTGGAYEVRRASTSTGAVDPGVIVDKRNPNEVMAGYAVTQLAGRDSWVYTLYQGPEGPFVHALKTAEGAAACIDLPASDKAIETESTAAAWGLALSANGRSLYAVNSALGTVNELSLDDHELRRSGTLPAQAGGIALVKFENGKWNDAGSAAVSPDGTTLYVGGPSGVAAIGTSDLATRATLGGDRGYRSLAVSARGQLYAVDTGGALHRLGFAESPEDAMLGGQAFATIEGVMTLGG